MNAIETKIVEIRKQLILELKQSKELINDVDLILHSLMSDNSQQRVAAQKQIDIETLRDYGLNLGQLMLHMKKDLELISLYSIELEKYINTSEYDIELLATNKDIAYDIVMIISSISLHYKKAQKFIAKISMPNFVENISELSPIIGDIKVSHHQIGLFLEHFGKSMEREMNVFYRIDELLEKGE